MISIDIDPDTELLPCDRIPPTATSLHLKVHRVEQTCLFDLTWGQGQHLAAALPWRSELLQHYQHWQQAYLQVYRHLEDPAPAPPVSPTSLRGRVQSSGGLTSAVDWSARLVEAEAQLLYDFHRWLRSPELFEIRAQIGHQAQGQPVDLYLTCHPLEVARLPWESWEIGSEFAAVHPLRLVRSPARIRAPANAPPPRRRPRLLVILGDETGLNFAGDRAAIGALNRLAEVVFVGWQPGCHSGELKRQIANTIAADQGWDGLLFAGHSNETALTGGELAIAPGVTLTVRELAPSLAIAQQRGLRFALFNSCSGLNLAESLIDLGLSQVAIFREPVHNQVAHVFLRRFLQRLAAHDDVHTALIQASQALKLEHALTYPSAHLVPSLFRHPDAPLYRIAPKGWRQQLRAWLPTRYEVAVIGVMVTLSLLPPLQRGLLDQRLWSQAIYRDRTGQLPAASPELLLVTIDNDSLIRADISNPRPMDRRYLARVVDKTAQLQPAVISIDYLLDRPLVSDDNILAQTLETAAQDDIWFILATYLDQTGQWLTPLPALGNPDWSWQGDIKLFGQGRLVPLLLSRYSPDWPLPLAYLMALADVLSSGHQSVDLSQGHQAVPAHLTSPRMQPASVTTSAYRLGQTWLHPIVDYSLPPQRLYSQIPAWQLLESSPPQLRQDYPQAVVMIMPGGYGEAGVSELNEDNFPLPAAMAYWRQRQAPANNSTVLLGGEVHGYLFHHFRHRHLVVPLPDLWLVLMAALLSKVIDQTSLHRRRQCIFLVSGSLLYAIISLQVYVAGLVLLPIALPLATLWFYRLPFLMRR
ncbi:hypothetical protein XM38_044170 [Halomicronema hongdechloris C2206]|uniref:Uncharacterized protein n=1 Tax=Halomicronema hongdechloris C2206 TaxID=1641165 RepID=A0A1Z3HT06_9CYAN|nr:CHASE2 domain-containing protein [Halomicronema hongdechloris]ASC73450.1 hypothetical protein XM38_044170 [Halomicronema hongdechloris C2206]